MGAEQRGRAVEFRRAINQQREELRGRDKISREVV